MNNQKGGVGAALLAAATWAFFAMIVFIILGLTFMGARDVWHGIFG